jgi:DNA-3-methyladenine glycosylase II
MKPRTEPEATVDTATYLSHAVAGAREHGFVPAAAPDAPPTWRGALDRLELGADLTPADLRRAHEILGWAAALKPRDPGGYRARIVACLAHERMTIHELPLAASAVRAFNLHLHYEIRGRTSRKQPRQLEPAPSKPHQRMTPGGHRLADNARHRARAIAHLRQADRVLARLIDSHPDFDPRAWLSDLPEMDAFGVLIFQIIGQQLSLAATRGILGRLVDRFDGRLPTPSQLLAADPEDLRRAGLSRRKVQTLRALTERFEDARLSVRELQTLPDEEVEARLTEVPGVGAWTAQGFLIIALGREDVVLPGDVALRNTIRRAHGLDHLPSPEEVLAIAQAWRPYRTRATSYLFASAFEPQASSINP